jgi:hypothetical protein
MTMQDVSIDDGLNPLDCVEDVLMSHNWIFDRRNHDELIVEVAGRNTTYRLFFVWQEDMNAIQFCCQYGFKIPESKFDQAARVLMDINEKTWMGHFDLSTQSTTNIGVPCFRYTTLLRGMTSAEAGSDMFEDLVDVALAQCEQYLTAFDMLANKADMNHAHYNLALMETAGES